MSAQGWSAATTLGRNHKCESTLKALGLSDINPFRVKSHFFAYPRLSLRSNLGLELANAFGVRSSRSPDQIDRLFAL